MGIPSPYNDSEIGDRTLNLGLLGDQCPIHSGRVGHPGRLDLHPPGCPTQPDWIGYRTLNLGLLGGQCPIHSGRVGHPGGWRSSQPGWPSLPDCCVFLCMQMCLKLSIIRRTQNGENNDPHLHIKKHRNRAGWATLVDSTSIRQDASTGPNGSDIGPPRAPDPMSDLRSQMGAGARSESPRGEKQWDIRSFFALV